MPIEIEYFLAPQSPWTYLGHARFAALTAKAVAAGARLQVKPMDLGQIFPVSGGLPLPKRAPQRQAYRLVELARFATALGLPLNLHPKFFPVPGDDAARLIIAVNAADGAEKAVELAGRVLAAVWVQERNINSAETLTELLAEADLSVARWAESKADDVQQLYAAHTQRAIDIGIFGAPSYVIDGEIFWGQDRLDFVARRLA